MKQNESNGTDPVMERLERILEVLTELSDNLGELTEKVADLTITNEGFGYTEPES